MAAQTLVESGGHVLMLDGGFRDEKYQALTPDKTFVAIRTQENDQHRYLLGDDFESIPRGDVGTGAQLTPSRRFITQEVDRFLPLLSDSFFPMESLGYGGLGSGWGLGCCVFSEAELEKAGMPPAEMREAYQLVASRIGISGSQDDARPYTFAHLEGIQPATPPDPAAVLMLQRYRRRQVAFAQAGFHLGRPALALLTEAKDGRKAASLHDMDFYSDAGQAAYRPWITVEQLKRDGNFRYEGSTLVTRFQEDGGNVTVHALDLRTLAPKRYTCRRLLLASGTLGTARIVLRSLQKENARLPLLCNPYTYIPCLLPGRIGKAMPERNIGFAQLALFHDPGGTHDNVAMASLYTYRSLLLFRLLHEVPLNFNDARLLMRYLLPGILIMSIHHPESASPEKFLELAPHAASPTGDCLHAAYQLNDAEQSAVNDREKRYVRAMRSLGAWALKRVYPGNGSSIHYAGTLPFSLQEQKFTLHPSGRLHTAQNVYVADGSGFAYLPAKGLTLSLMANAHLVAKRLAQRKT